MGGGIMKPEGTYLKTQNAKEALLEIRNNERIPNSKEGLNDKVNNLFKKEKGKEMENGRKLRKWISQEVQIQRTVMGAGKNENNINKKENATIKGLIFQIESIQHND